MCIRDRTKIYGIVYHTEKSNNSNFVCPSRHRLIYHEYNKLQNCKEITHLILEIHEATTIKTIGYVRFFRKFYFWLLMFNTIVSIRILNTSCMILNVHLILFLYFRKVIKPEETLCNVSTTICVYC